MKNYEKVGVVIYLIVFIYFQVKFFSAYMFYSGVDGTDFYHVTVWELRRRIFGGWGFFTTLMISIPIVAYLVRKLSNEKEVEKCL